MWPEAGTLSYLDIGVTVLSDQCSAGTEWRTWEGLEAYDYLRQTGLSGKPWPVWMDTNFSAPGTGDSTIPGNGPIFRWGNVEDGWEDFGQRLLENGPTGPTSKSVWDPYIFR